MMVCRLSRVSLVFRAGSALKSKLSPTFFSSSLLLFSSSSLPLSLPSPPFQSFTNNIESPMWLKFVTCHKSYINAMWLYASTYYVYIQLTEM